MRRMAPKDSNLRKLFDEAQMVCVINERVYHVSLMYWRPVRMTCIQLEKDVPEEIRGKYEFERDTEVKQHGLIAQEVKAALDKAGVDTFLGWSEEKDGTQMISESMFVFPLIKAIKVSHGFDVADDYIADVVESTDLVITADIPLADKVIDKHAIALNPRGELYTKENIKQRLGMRNFMDQLRSSGVNTGGPKTLSNTDIQKFANALDRYLTKMRK